MYEGTKDDFLNYSHSDVTKDTAGSKDTTDTASASPSVKKKETMAAVKTVSWTCELHVENVINTIDNRDFV